MSNVTFWVLAAEPELELELELEFELDPQAATTKTTAMAAMTAVNLRTCCMTLLGGCDVRSPV
jgi:hypothetical protein